MRDTSIAHPPPSAADGDGVRVTRTRPTPGAAARVSQWLAAAAIVAGLGYLVLSLSEPSGPAARGRAHAVEMPAPAPAAQRASAAAVEARARPVRVAAEHAREHEPGPDDLPQGDPDDLATYFRPGDPEPTAAEVIQALHDIGDHTGLGAFNPPGTSPPLRGLAVPEDFVLPPGYVRHHQVTDEGEPLEPILMFSPDVVFLDAAGREIAIPENRVVPPEMAPPGLPLRDIDLPPAP